MKTILQVSTSPLLRRIHVHSYTIHKHTSHTSSRVLIACAIDRRPTNKQSFQHKRTTHHQSMPADVDRSIPSQTSGSAATLAAAHQAEKPLKLYAGWFCPFVQRTWITLNEKNIDYQYIEINPYHKDPDFLKLNPRGLVPTLAVEVPTPESVQSKKRTLKPLYESIVIAEYLDEHYADPTKYGPRLLPEGTDTLSAYERARCRLWIDHISSRIVPAFYKFIQHTPEKAYSIEDIRTEFLGHIATWIREVIELDAERENLGQPAGPWFLGDRFSLVDITLAPWAFRLFLIDHYKPGGVGIPEKGRGGDDEQVWERWRTWFDAVRSRDSMTQTMSDDEQYIEAYKRYAEDKTQSQVGQATRTGGGLP